MTKLRPFAEIMRELLDQSGMTRDELSEKISQDANCPVDQEVGMAPSYELIAAMVRELKPSNDQELELFRAVAPIIAADDSKDFSQMFKSYRKGLGITLEAIGAKLKACIQQDNDDVDFNILVALFELGERTPTVEEASVIADYFSLIAHEKNNFVDKSLDKKVAHLQVVGDGFQSEESTSWDEKILQAKELIKQDSSQNRDFIIDEAAKLLINKKQEDS